MSVRNTISNPGQSSSGQPGELPSSAPNAPGFWQDDGVLKYWDGNESKSIDFAEGQVLDAFGNPTGIDI